MARRGRLMPAIGPFPLAVLIAWCEGRSRPSSVQAVGYSREAPTGGYLPQACFSTGVAAGRAAAAWASAAAGGPPPGYFASSRSASRAK